jgi:hypothetical protein
MALGTWRVDKPLIRKTLPYAKKIAHRDVWVEPSPLAEIDPGKVDGG